MSDYYTTKAASELTGASKQIIRTYTERYARHLSTEATPEPGKPRRFTATDLKLLAYVYQQTSTGNLTHDQVLERLAAGALEEFDWQIPAQSAMSGAEESVSAPSALVAVERLQAAQVLLIDSQRREGEAKEREQALIERVAALERALGQAQGELTAYKSLRRRPRWWTVLFGGE